MYKVLGIDLAFRKTGYAMINERGIVYKTAIGVIDTEAYDSVEDKLNALYNGVMELLSTHTPDLVVVEVSTTHTNFKTSRKLAMAEAIIRTSLYNEGQDFILVPPGKVRKTLKLNNDKREVFDYIVNKKKLKNFVFSKHADITDAIACAMYGIELFKRGETNV